MVLVQVGTRIVDWADDARASKLAKAQNVKRVVRRRKDNAIMRIIIEPHAAGNGWASTPSEHQSSCKSTTIERLDVESGVPFVYSHKPSRLYQSSRRPAGIGAPTTIDSRRSSGNSGNSPCQ